MGELLPFGHRGIIKSKVRVRKLQNDIISNFPLLLQFQLQHNRAQEMVNTWFNGMNKLIKIKFKMSYI